jgi:hypothetical protein
MKKTKTDGAWSLGACALLLAGLLLATLTGPAGAAETTLRGMLVDCGAALAGATFCLERDDRGGRVVVLTSEASDEQPMYVTRSLDSLQVLRLPVTVRGTLVGTAFDASKDLVILSRGGETRVIPTDGEQPTAVATPPAAAGPSPAAFGSLRELIRATKPNPARAISLYGEATPGFELLAAVRSVELQRGIDGRQFALVRLGNEVTQFGRGITIVSPELTADVYCVAPIDAVTTLEPRTMVRVRGTLAGTERTQRYMPYARGNVDYDEIAARCAFTRAD